MRGSGTRKLVTCVTRLVFIYYIKHEYQYIPFDPGCIHVDLKIVRSSPCVLRSQNVLTVLGQNNKLLHFLVPHLENILETAEHCSDMEPVPRNQNNLRHHVQKHFEFATSGIDVAASV
jgi:hypothetical protein